LHLGLQQDLDALIRHQLQKRRRHVRILPYEKSRPELDDRDAAAEPPQRLGEFQTDIAPAEDDEVAGQAFKVQGFDVRHRPSGKSGHIGDTGAGADVDEDALAPQQPCAAGVQRHPYRFRFREPRLAHYQLRAAGLEPGEVQLDHLIDHVAFATGDAGHIDAHRPGHHSQARGRVEERNGLGTVNDVLAGQAAHVHAGAADHGAFDDHGFLALFRQGPGEDFAHDAAANDQIADVLDSHDALLREVGGVSRRARDNMQPRCHSRAENLLIAVLSRKQCCGPRVRAMALPSPPRAPRFADKPSPPKSNSGPYYANPRWLRAMLLGLSPCGGSDNRLSERLPNRVGVVLPIRWNRYAQPAGTLWRWCSAGLPFLALEFVASGSLARWLAVQPLPPRDAALQRYALAPFALGRDAKRESNRRVV
jgi:hypothetical protein